jgi:long-chain acyl-CoA synthetase
MNLYTRLQDLARYQPDRVAVESAGLRLSYGAFETLASRIAGLLRGRGVGPGDVVGLRLQDTPQHLAALFAVMRLGAIVLPVDWRGTRAEFDRLVARFEPRIVLDDSGPALGWPRLQPLHGLDAQQPDPRPPADIVDAPMGYSLTSGTTGEPKAVVVSHEQLHARFSARVVEGLFDREDRFLTVWPLAYAGGREHAICLLLLGASIVQFPSLFRPAELVDLVRDRRITATALSPNRLRDLLELPRGGKPLLDGLRVLIIGAAKVQPEERALAREHLCPRLLDYYGNTGAGAIAVVSAAADGLSPTAVGRPAVGIEVQIVDAEDAPVPDGETGELRLRGPAVSTRSIGATEGQREGIRNGWYYPGDRGRLDARGLLHLEGRAADLIKRGGVMVHAQEVEQALRRHAGIADVAVVGVPSARLGQDVVAFVVARAPLDERDVIRHCRAELAPSKVPSSIAFVADLPRNAGGKVDKQRLLASRVRE